LGIFRNGGSVPNSHEAPWYLGNSLWGVFLYFCNDPILGIVREVGGPWDPLWESRSPQGRGGLDPPDDADELRRGGYPIRHTHTLSY
jgi:hypothetical protein